MLKPAGNSYMLVDDYIYKDVIVPTGFHTDGLSYKFRLVGIFINKYDPKYIEAAIVHDYLTYVGDWEKANRYFEEMLPKTLTSKLMVNAVKLYRKFKGV